METLARLLRWTLKKLTFGALLLVLGIICFGLWVYVRDNVDFDLRRSEVIRAMTGEVRKLESALADVEARMSGMRTEIAAQESRAVDAARVARQLDELNSGFNRLSASSEQVRENEARIVRMHRMEADSRKRIEELQQSLTRAQWERDGLQIALGRMKTRRAAVEKQTSQVEHYLREAWDRYGRHVLAVVAVYFFGPPLGRLAAFFVWAPLIASRRPVRFGDRAPEGGPEIETSRAALGLSIRPGQTLWIKEKFLQASDEGLKKRTKTVLDWRIPLTCAATGLTEMIEMRNAADTDYSATFSSQEDFHTEIAAVTIPEGAGMIVRPRFLAGIIGDRKLRLRIRRHWRLFSVHSWVTGQFRHFEFVGPCRLLLAAGRGVRAETLHLRQNGVVPARRTNREATIGFTTGLGYRPVRAETFWAYMRGMNPLFDDLFIGEGVFLCQESAARDPSAKQPGFGAKLWDALLRVFGV